MMREADRDLGRRDHEGEEHEHLAADVVQLSGERHEGEVDGVEHQLDAHEHHDHVAANSSPTAPIVKMPAASTK